MLIIVVSFLIVAIGLGIASFAIIHERDWRKRLRNSVVVNGIVIAEHSDPEWENTRAEIEYEIDGHAHRFVSKYGTGMLSVGHHVRVIMDTTTGDAERLAFTTRWVFTIGPILLGAFFVYFGLCIAHQYGG
ncbi:hypothetical protein LF1_55220 [Rubripirellula obstinata]|uniref:DUF3592 domain-containing protein n=1 Tax=Rubripirellula obstinata TaxID=406547 RepID=A0A5B1CA21_9BACT|nr:hypothetical protein [Rubripirellula obstinata]KAA1257122.1 hypothetical protein LF1_55220 [Rubripirellula obstinata]